MASNQCDHVYYIWEQINASDLSKLKDILFTLAGAVLGNGSNTKY